MAVAAKPASSFTVRRAEPRDRETVRGLIAEMAPALDPDRRLAWLYDGNVHGKAYTWLAIDQGSGEAAGLTSYFPFDVTAGAGSRARCTPRRARRCRRSASR
jgi:hypothetical protein